MNRDLESTPSLGGEDGGRTSLRFGGIELKWIGYLPW